MVQSKAVEVRVRFEWQAEEWREACLLAAAAPRARRHDSPTLTYAVLVLMALGGVGDAVQAVRASRTIGLRGSLLPILLGAAILAGILFLVLRLLRRHRQLRHAPHMPVGEQQVLLREDGWANTSEPLPLANDGELSETAGAVSPAALRPWQDLRERRIGERIVVLVGTDKQVTAFPLRAINDDQHAHLNRLLIRKVPTSVQVS